MSSFEQELRDAQAPLLGYIGVLCGVPQEAPDILGDVNLSLLRQRDVYDPSRPFLPWAKTVAFYHVKGWRTKRHRSRIVFDEALMARLAEDEQAPGEDEVARDGEFREELLKEARNELTPEMQYLLTRHYGYGDSLRAIGLQLNRNPHSVAVSLHYIRNVLRKSVAKKMKEHGHER